MLRHIPNIITIIRILLIVPIVLLLINDEYEWAISLIVIAGLSDALDGYLARKYHWQSELGAMLDPLADKAFLAGLIVVLGAKQLLPFWLVLGVVARDVIILIGAGFYQLVTRDLKMQPLWVSKINTALLVLLVLLVTFSMLVVSVPAWLIDGMVVIVALSTLISGIAYVVVWTRYTIKFKQE